MIVFEKIGSFHCKTWPISITLLLWTFLLCTMWAPWLTHVKWLQRQPYGFQFNLLYYCNAGATLGPSSLLLFLHQHRCSALWSTERMKRIWMLDWLYKAWFLHLMKSALTQNLITISLKIYAFLCHKFAAQDPQELIRLNWSYYRKYVIVLKHGF